jgi:membrane protein required for beta-lactamase induction
MVNHRFLSEDLWFCAMASGNAASKKSPAKMFGHRLVVLSIPILVVVALLLSMKDVNLGIVGLLLGFAIAMLVIGSVLSYLRETH